LIDAIIGLARWLARRPRLTALLGAVAIAGSGVLYRLAVVTPETGTFFRCLYGLPLLWLAVVVERRQVTPMPWRGRWIAAFAGVLFFADLLFWQYAIDAVGAGLATVLANLQVVFVAVVAWLLFGERPSSRTLAALPIMLLGVALIGGVIGAGTYGDNPPLGVVFGIGSAISYGAYLIVVRRLSRSHVAEPVAVSTLSTTAVALIWGLAIGKLDLVPYLPAHFWLLLLGITAQSAGYLLISLSLPRLPAVVVSIILLAQPVMSVGLAMLIVGETPSSAQLLGVAMVIGGIALATVPLRGARRRRAMPATP
jgi:drug/metabolite transporter (DMT)-like permease